MFDAPSAPPSDAPNLTTSYTRTRRTDRGIELPTEKVRPIALVRDADMVPRPRTLPELTPRTRSEVVVRAINIAISGMALVILAPVMMLVALAIKMSSPGPVIYAQTRVGQDRRRRSRQHSHFDRRSCDLGGRVFRIYKFRTMRIDAERRGVQWATNSDPAFSASFVSTSCRSSSTWSVVT